MKFFRTPIVTFFVFLIVLTLGFAPALAQEEPEMLVVTPVNLRGWTTADTRPGGTSALILSAVAPRGTGSLSLVTDNTTAAKAQFMHPANIPLADLSELSYYTKQNSALFTNGAPSFQLALMLGGTAGFTTMVYEPYNNGYSITQGLWQQWDVDAGTMWSSRSFSSGTCNITAGAGGPPFYSLAHLKAACPAAVVVGFGVNVGTYNAGWNTEADLVKFNNTTYDFEVYSTPATIEECKQGGWLTFNPPTGPYRNQGQCVSFAASGQ